MYSVRSLLSAYSRSCHSLAGLRQDLADLFARARFGGRGDVDFLAGGNARFFASPVEGATFSNKFGPRPKEIFNVDIEWGLRTAPQLDTRVARVR